MSVTSELLVVRFFSLGKPHQRFLNLLGSKKHILSLVCVHLACLIALEMRTNTITSINSNCFAFDVSPR